MKYPFSETSLNRRWFLAQTGAAATGALMLPRAMSAAADTAESEPLKPIGEAKGIHPGRVAWVRNPEATKWMGPGNGHWWEPTNTDQKSVDAMMSRSLMLLTGESTDAKAWKQLFQHRNQTNGKGSKGHQAGEKVFIKVNFVGCIRGGGNVNPENYNLEKRRDYMNTSPQVILALLRQLAHQAGIKQSDIMVGDLLGYFPNEYYNLLHVEFPDVGYVDCGGKFGRILATASDVPFYWSCRPEKAKPDFVPEPYARSSYLINLANLKAHTGAGVTLCAKNHYGSMVRGPMDNGYYEMHRSAFAKETKVYRTAVDLMGHAHFGGKTMLYLLDGLYPGKHPIDPAPRKWSSYPFNGRWAASLLASQDPVAIDSVGLDFLRTEWDDYPRQVGAGDYLCEAALASNPPSGTFYDPDHSAPVKRLASLGVHEHWNNPRDKKYSRNLGTGKGIELVNADFSS